MTVIASFNEDPRSFKFKPYHNGDVAYPVVRLKIDYSRMPEGLARFLATNVTSCIHHRGSLQITLYNGKSEAEFLREAYADAKESIIRAYGLENIPSLIQDYEFPKIFIGEPGEQYFKRVAHMMVTKGAEMVKITGARLPSRRVYFT